MKAWLEGVFTGQAVHNQTYEELVAKYGDEVLSYNPSNGPDFTHVPTGEMIELTTPGQVGAHMDRVVGDKRYACWCAIYDLPAPGT